VADKNFKVKSGLQVPSLTTAGPVTTDSAGNVTSSATLPISQGGTGQTTAGNALNALLPLQTSQDNKFLQTNGVTTQWTTPQQHTATDGVLGSRVYSGTVTPSSPVTGDLWIDQTTGNGIQLVRWRKTVASATTTVTGLDDNNLTLSYTSGNEQVYINGVLITRGQDYTATNGTSVVLTQAAEVGDTIEIFGNPLFSVTDAYTQSQSNSLYVSKSGLDAAGKNYLINGGMDVWQRGTSFAVTGLGYAAYTVDRWTCYAGAAGTITQDTSLYAPGTRYGLRFTSTVSSSAQNWYQMVETSNAIALAGQTVCLSLYAAGTTGTTGHYMNLQYSNNVDASLFDAGWTNCSGTTLSYPAMTGTMQRHIATFVVPNTAKSLRVQWTTGLLTNAQFQTIGGFQLELGSVATPFSRAGGDIQGELAKCQRYFYTLPYNYNAERANPYTDFLIMNTADQTGWARGVVQFPVTMRTSPTLQAPTAANYYILGSAGVLSVTSISIDNMTNASMAVVNAYRTGMSTGTTYFLRFAGNVTDYLRFSAEL
jgi:hypothetical protein